MKKAVLATLLLASLYLPARAQQAPPRTPALWGTDMRPGQRDTLEAISKHYARRRGGGYVWLAIGGGGLLALVRVLANPNTSSVNGYQTSSSVDGGAAATVGIFFIGLPAAIGVSKLARFSTMRENEARQAYSLARVVPRGLGRRLQRKDFR